MGIRDPSTFAITHAAAQSAPDSCLGLRKKMAETTDTLIKFSDIVIAGATLLGPIFAVQAQKWLEAGREKKARMLAIFRTLMATRAALLSQAHVEALNSVPRAGSANLNRTLSGVSA